MEALQAENALLRQQLQALKEELDAAMQIDDEEISRLHDEMVQQHRAIEQLQKEKLEVEASSRTATEQLNTLLSAHTVAVAQLQSEHAAVQQLRDAACQHAKDQLVLQEQKSLLSELKQELKTAKARANACQQQEEAERQHSKQLLEELEPLRQGAGDASHLKAALLQAKQIMQDLQDEKARLLSVQAASAKQLESARAAQQAAAGQAAKSQSTIKTLQEQLGSAYAAEQTALGQAVEAQCATKTLQGQLDSAREAQQAAVAQAAKAQLANQTLLGQLKAGHAVQDANSKQTAKLQVKLKSLQGQLDTARAAHQVAGQQAQDLQAQLESTRQLFDNSQAQVAKQQEEMEKAKAGFLVQLQLMNSLAQDNSSLQAECTALRAQCEAETQLESLQHQLVAAEAAADAAVGNIHLHVSQLQTEHHQHLEAQATLEDRYKALQEQHEELRMKYAASTRATEQFVWQSDVLQRDISDLQAALGKQQDQNAHLQSQLQASGDSLADAKVQYQQLDLRCKELKQDYRALQTWQADKQQASDDKVHWLTRKNASLHDAAADLRHAVKEQWGYIAWIQPQLERAGPQWLAYLWSSHVAARRHGEAAASPSQRGRERSNHRSCEHVSGHADKWCSSHAHSSTGNNPDGQAQSGNHTLGRHRSRSPVDGKVASDELSDGELAPDAVDEPIEIAMDCMPHMQGQCKQCVEHV